MDKNKQWTDSLPELLDGYTETAPEGLWDAVQAGLQPPKRRALPLWWIAGPLAAAAAVVLAVVLWPERRVPQIILPEDGTPESLAVNVPDQTPAKEEPVVTEIPAVIPAVKPFVLSASLLADAHADTPADEVTAPAETLLPAADDAPAETPVETPAETPVTEPAEAKPFETPFIPPVQEQIKKKFRGSVQLALLSGGCLSPETTLQKSGFGLPAQPGIVTRGTDAGLPGDGVTVFMVNRNKTSTLEAEHSQLTRFQFGLHYRFQPRWGTETGVVLSRLQSRFESTSGQSQSITKRQVSYLGIPLYLHYQALQKNRLGLYLQAGPMYEITLDTPSTTWNYIAGKEQSSRTDYTYIRDDIWSFNVNAGLQFRLFRHGAIFVQPGFSWHFARENNLETYYTTHPAAFSLSLGYRVLLY
jgi:hypothetical protein